MKNRKVSVLRLHLGGRLAVTSISIKQHGAEMDWYPTGVLVRVFKGKRVDVWYYESNIIEAELVPDEEK